MTGHGPEQRDGDREAILSRARRARGPVLLLVLGAAACARPGLPPARATSRTASAHARQSLPATPASAATRSAPTRCRRSATPAFPWRKYRTITVREVQDGHADRLTRVPAEWQGGFAPFFRMALRLTYAGGVRSVPAAKREFIGMAMEGYGVDPKQSEPFVRELSFDEGGQRLWFPTRTALVPEIQRELHVGDAVTLFASWAGVRRVEGGFEYVFLLNEFSRSGTICE